MTQRSPFRYFKTSPEIIRLAVMLYIRFPLSLRNVEDLLHERGIDVSHEAVRFWWNRFGPMFAAEIRKRRVQGLKSSRWRWHLDEVFVKINGETHYLWRAVDHEGEVLESFVTKRRDRKAALKFLRKSMKRFGSPQVIVTDKLRSYGAAMKVIGNADRQETGRWLNNRAENSHLPFRRRERAMLRFRRMHCHQKFAAVHASAHASVHTPSSIARKGLAWLTADTNGATPKSTERKMKTLKLALLSGALSVSAMGAVAETFRWASTTDPQTMDPHAVNSAPVLSFLNNVYEGLVRRGQDMSIEPSLAISWEPLEGENGWRFNLRQGVTFQNGAAFTAEDVLFSYQRASDEVADVRSWFAPVIDVRVVDELTVEFVTSAPNPLFPDSIANFMILDKDWAEANDAVLPARDAENFATLNVNGTGPFTLASRDPGVRTTLTPNETWWDEVGHNITEAVFTPIGNSATGLAALLSGEIDFIQPIPLQDIAQVEGRNGFKILEGEETRVIMFGFGHEHDALLYSSDVTDTNPFADPRVRLAAAHALDIESIDRVLFRGKIEPASQLVPAGISGFSEANQDRPAFDPERAKELLAEAGYPDGFSFGLKCTNDRYINDEALCRAAASMFAAVGLNAELTTGPVRDYWPQLREDDFDMYLLGWSPGTFDMEHPIRFLMHSQDDERKLGSWNFGNYSNARVDELLPQIQQEIDPAARQVMIDEVVAITQDEVAYIPLYTQPLIWAAKDNVDLTQRADNFFMLRWVTVN